MVDIYLARMQRWLVMALIVEPARHVTAFFLNTPSRFVPEFDAEVASLVSNMITAESSPVTHCLQYLSAVPFAHATRSRLLVSEGVCPSLNGWCVHFTQHAEMLQNAVCFASCWICCRHHKDSNTWPWRLLKVFDERLSADVHLVVEDELFRAAPCCLPFGLARRMGQRRVGLRSCIAPISLPGETYTLFQVCFLFFPYDFAVPSRIRRFTPRQVSRQVIAVGVASEKCIGGGTLRGGGCFESICDYVSRHVVPLLFEFVLTFAECTRRQQSRLV